MVSCSLLGRCVSSISFSPSVIFIELRIVQCGLFVPDFFLGSGLLVAVVLRSVVRQVWFRLFLR